MTLFELPDIPPIAYSQADLTIFDGKPEASHFFKAAMSDIEMDTMRQKIEDMRNSTNDDGSRRFSESRISAGCFTEALRFAILKRSLAKLEIPTKVYLVPSKGPNQADDGDFYISLSGEEDKWDYVWDEKSFSPHITDIKHEWQFYDYITHSVTNPYPKLNNWIIGNTVYFKKADQIVVGPAIWGGYFMKHAIGGAWTQECAKNRRALKHGPYSWSTTSILRYLEKVASGEE